MNNMTTRYRLTCRGIRGGMFYCVDKSTGKRTSLKTTDAEEARQLVAAKNQAERQPVLNLHLARAYLAGANKGLATRTWQHALDALIQTKLATNQQRWRSANTDRRGSGLRGVRSRMFPDGRRRRRGNGSAPAGSPARK
jgi:hypothetical protein